jgi:threonine/homoserine/homoserine lactone efflux protein
MRLLAVCVSAFVLGFVGSVPLAGPVAVMVLSRAAQGRFREALRIGLGASVAEGLYAGAAFWGFTTLLSRNALVVPVSRGAAAIVLLALGVRFMFWRPASKDDSRENKAGTALLGFTVSALNPTLFITWSAAAAIVHSGSDGPGSHTQLDAVPFGAAAAAGIAAWFFVLVALVRRYEGSLPKNALAWSVRALGLCLVALGVWSAVRLGAWFLTTRSARPLSTHEAAAHERSSCLLAANDSTVALQVHRGTRPPRNRHTPAWAPHMVALPQSAPPSPTTTSGLIAPSSRRPPSSPEPSAPSSEASDSPASPPSSVSSPVTVSSPLSAPASGIALGWKRLSETFDRSATTT